MRWIGLVRKFELQRSINHEPLSLLWAIHLKRFAIHKSVDIALPYKLVKPFIICPRPQNQWRRNIMENTYKISNLRLLWHQSDPAFDCGDKSTALSCLLDRSTECLDVRCLRDGEAEQPPCLKTFMNGLLTTGKNILQES
jgi:hypothetical protein